MWGRCGQICDGDSSLAMATLCVSLPSTVVGCSGGGQFSGRHPDRRLKRLSPPGRRFQGGASKQVQVKVWTVRASLEVRPCSNFRIQCNLLKYQFSLANQPSCDVLL